MTMLIATPARATTPRPLIERCGQLVNSFSGAGVREWRLYLNEQPQSGEKYQPNANARNELIERYLRPEHEWVLWFDADIIEAPANLIEVLMEASLRHGGGVVAPMVWVERVGEGRPSIPVGGWFYDTGGFQKMDGSFADFEHGVDTGDGDEVEMRSVGCVYLAPAALYRMGLRYRPQNGEVEHLSFFRAARQAGTTVWATRKANVTHAYLPKWGEQWHSN